MSLYASPVQDFLDRQMLQQDINQGRNLGGGLLGNFSGNLGDLFSRTSYGGINPWMNQGQQQKPIQEVAPTMEQMAGIPTPQINFSDFYTDGPEYGTWLPRGNQSGPTGLPQTGGGAMGAPDITGRYDPNMPADAQSLAGGVLGGPMGQPLPTGSNQGGINYTPPQFNQSSGNPLQNMGLAGLAGLLTGSGNIGAAVLGGLGAYDQMQNIGNTQQNYANYINSMMQQLPQNVEFKPYTVTSGLGTTTTTPEGGVGMQLSGQQQALSNQMLGGASGLLGQATQGNQGLQAQSNLFNAMLGGYQGSPLQQYNLQQGYNTGFTPDSISPYGYGNAQLGQMSNQLLGTNVAGAGQAGAQLGAQGAGMTQQGLGMLSNMGPNAQIAGLGSQAMGLGQQGLATAGQAGGALAGLQSAAAQQAQGMLSGLGGTSMAQREQDIYNRIRATQTPEENRARTALEERMFAQGRMGVGSGDPEQFAQEKAFAEARNNASLSAIQQAQAEQQQAYQQATGMAGLTGQLLGQGSDLQTAAQQRATQLSNLGLSAEQINSQLQSEGLSRGLQTTQAGVGMQQAGSGLSTEAQNRAAQLAQMGMSAAQINSQLQSEGLSRGIQAGTYGRQGATLASDLLSAAQGRDIQRGQFDLAQQLQAQGMGAQDIQNMLALAGGSQGALAQQMALQSGLGQLGLGMLSGGYMPYEQARADFAMGNLPAQLAASGRDTATGLLAQLGLGGLAEQTKLETLRNNMMSQLYQSMGGMFTGGAGGASGGISADSLVGQGLDWLGNLFGGGSGGNSGGGYSGVDFLGQNYGAYTPFGSSPDLGYSYGGGFDPLGYSNYFPTGGLGTTAGGVNLSGVGGNDYLGAGQYDTSFLNLEQ